MSFFSELPPELRQYIYDLVSEDHKRRFLYLVRSVCRAWRDAASGLRLIWKIRKRGREGDVDRLLKIMPNICKLSIKHRVPAMNEADLKALGEFPSLRALSITVPCTEEQMFFLGRLNKLEKLTISKSPITAAVINLLSQRRSLHTLHIASAVFHQGALSPLTSLFALQNLTLENSTLLEPLKLPKLRQLTYLAFWEISLPSSQPCPFEEFRVFSYLEKLAVRVSSDYATALNTDHLSSLSTLRMFIFTTPLFMSGTTSFFTALSRLERLSLHVPKHPQIDHLTALHHLRELNFAGGVLCSPAVCADLAHLTALQLLNLDRCLLDSFGSGVKDLSGLSSLSKLELLVITSPIQLHDQGLESLTALRSLRVLSLHCGPKLTPKAVTPLTSLTSLRLLELVNMAAAPHSTGLPLDFDSSKTPLLVITLKWVPKITRQRWW